MGRQDSDSSLVSVKRMAAAVGVCAMIALLGACSGGDVEASYPERVSKGRIDPAGSNKPKEGLFGQDGLRLFGPSTKPEEQGNGIGVNGFLWRASLDSVSFMPLAQADPFGGVIISEWYSPPETPAERFKVNVFIMGRQLRADGIKAAVFRQARDSGGNWTDAPVEQRTITELENAILTRARQLRIDTARP